MLTLFNAIFLGNSNFVNGSVIKIDVGAD